MINAVKDNINVIIQACKEMEVQSLYLFGSGARATDYHQKSDLDFLFQFKKDKNGLPQTTYDYFDLLFRLEDILERKIDLVAEERIRNEYFLKKVNAEKIKIYEA